jgi:hypothetical protein
MPTAFLAQPRVAAVGSLGHHGAQWVIDMTGAQGHAVIGSITTDHRH